MTKCHQKAGGPSDLWHSRRELAASGTQSVTRGWSVSRDSGALPSSLCSESHLGCQAEWCQVLSHSPPCLVFPSPKKMIPPLPPLPPQPLTLGKPKMSHRTSPLETGDSDFLLPKEAERDFLACHMVPGGLSSWPGSAVHPLPCDKLHFSCLSLHQLSGLSCLTLPYTMLLWREREKKKIRPRNRPEIQCLHMVPSCPLFSNENVLYDWGVMWSVKRGSRG